MTKQVITVSEENVKLRLVITRKEQEPAASEVRQNLAEPTRARPQPRQRYAAGRVRC
ncbi:MAG: hypothetical protein JRN58_03505 [Nitrososphaerota archaeon]|nr:hypothetical protein [Nitrososphaerota archaeon]